jgi:O-antigen/teichoic acid export membrane protein
MQTVLRIRQIDIVRRADYRVFFTRNIKKVLISSCAFYIVLLAGAFFLTHFVFPEYKASTTSTNILLTTAFISYLTIPFSFLQAFRKYRTVFILSLISLALNITINHYFTPSFGINAAAFSNMISFSFINIMGMLISLFIYGKDEIQYGERD